MTRFTDVLEVHAISNCKVSTPCESPFPEDAYDLAIQRRLHSLTVRGRVDVKGTAPRMPRDIPEVISQSADATLKATAITIGVSNIDCFG